MTLHYFRKTLISFSRKNEPLNFTNNPSISPLFSLFSFSFSTLVTPTKEPSSEIKDYLITQHGFSLETAIKTSAFLDRVKGYKNSAFVLDFLRKNGFSKSRLEDLVLCDPRVLTSDLNRCVKAKFYKVKDLGFSDSEFDKLLCNVPGVLTLPRSAESIAASISVLQSLLLSNSDVIRLLGICNWFLCSDLENIMLPNIELMENCGISKSQIRRMIFSFPRFFLMKPDVMKDCMRRVDEMGLQKDSKMYIHGVRVISSMNPENWELKLKLFRNLGLSDDDIRSVFRRIPHVLAISEKKVKEVSKLLLSSEGVDIAYLVQHAELLVYSPATRIKPRLDIINALMSKNLLERVPKMTSICKLENEVFIRRYVLPHAAELGEVGENFLVSTGFLAS